MATAILLSDLLLNLNKPAAGRSNGSDQITIPPCYIRPPSDRPKLTQVIHPNPISSPDQDHVFKIIDLDGAINGSPNCRQQIIGAIRDACTKDGFFLVKNHGMPEKVIDDMMELSRTFFRLPQSERMKNYSDDPMKAVRLSTSFNVGKEKVLNWRDYLRLHCYPLEDFVHHWPSNPPSFRSIAKEYCMELRHLAFELLELVSESLGLNPDYLNRAHGYEHGQHMAINYYPPCPEPELTYGLQGHTDPNTMTILLQDQLVAGLQVLKNGNWVSVDPVPRTFIVNVGDQLQVLSNGLYKSVVHRVVVNCERERISIPTFICPSPDTLIKPAEGLVDGLHPCLYRGYTYGEYYEKFWDKGLQVTSCVDNFLTREKKNRDLVSQ